LGCWRSGKALVTEEIGLMRKRYTWLAGILTTLAALLPSAVHAQSEGYSPPDPVWPLPLASTHMAQGGLYLDGSFVLLRETNPIQNQLVAVRGFRDFSGTVGVPGQFVGTGEPALNTSQLGISRSYVPGFEMGIGYRFQDGSSVALNFLYLLINTYGALATLVPRDFLVGQNFQRSFLFSPVTNFPIAFAGPEDDFAGNLPAGAGFGIWNAYDETTISLTQRFQQWEIVYRQLIHEDECWRAYGLMGPRFTWFWENFKWRTVDHGDPVTDSAFNVGQYSNIVSNRMYGPMIGVTNEWYMGHGFSLSFDLQTALFIDIVKERVKYELGAKFVGQQSRRAKTDYRFVPEVQSKMSLWWYPIEGVEVRASYDLMAFFNTIASPRPIDFDWGAVNPGFVNRARYLDGFTLGIAFIF
jgi:hypothetical protein